MVVPASDDLWSHDVEQIAVQQARALLPAAIALLFATMVVEAAENFVTVTLPKAVSIELPKNWIVLSNHQRITLDTSVESRLDLSGIEQDTSELEFAANYHDDRGNTIGIVNLRYYPDLGLSQADARRATGQDVQELDAALKENLLKGMETVGMSITSWSGTTQTEINGVTTFITEYRRASIKARGDFRVRLIRVFAEDRSVTLTISYLESAAIILQPITDRIIASLKLAGLATTPTPSVPPRSSSPVSDLYGGQWGLISLVSAIATWGLGLAPPLLVRFALVRRPMGRGWAVGLVALFWMLNIVLFTTLGSQSESHSALTLVAFVSYLIPRKGSKEIATRLG
jgi:hypothetical protein